MPSLKKPAMRSWAQTPMPPPVSNLHLIHSVSLATRGLQNQEHERCNIRCLVTPIRVLWISEAGRLHFDCSLDPLTLNPPSDLNFDWLHSGSRSQLPEDVSDGKSVRTNMPRNADDKTGLTRVPRRGTWQARHGEPVKSVTRFGAHGPKGAVLFTHLMFTHLMVRPAKKKTRCRHPPGGIDGASGGHGQWRRAHGGLAGNVGQEREGR